MDTLNFKSVWQIELRYKGMAILLIFVALVGFFLYQKAMSIREEVRRIYADSYFSAVLEPEPAKTSKMIFVGDIMLDRGVEQSIKDNGGGSYTFPFLKIADYLKSADLAIGNLEGPISDKGYNVGSIYSFRADPKAIGGLEFAGFDAVSFANNHVFDYTREAFEDTLKRLDKAGIFCVGAGFSEKEAYASKVITVGAAKIAFLAYSNLGSKSWEAEGDSSGIAWLSQEDLRSGIKEAKTRADLVVVMFHLGEEYKTTSNSEQKSFARLAIDSGADLVVGHHPHVAQEVEKYKGKYIAYSLGNFVFDQDFSKETMEGLALEVTIKDKAIRTVEEKKLKMNEFYQPALSE